MHLVKLLNWIVNVPVLKEGSKNIGKDSSHFTIEYKNEETSWRLECVFNDRDTGSIGVYLTILTGEMKHDVSFNISIRNYEKATMKITTFTRAIRETEELSSYGCSRFLTLEKLRQLCGADMRLHLRVEIYFCNVNKIVKSLNNVPISPGKCLDLMIFQHSEVRIKTQDGMEFNVNREILICNSRVFEKMFANDMTESQNATVEIIDYSGATMKELFRFIYFGEVYNIDEIGVELFEAADCYDIENLPEICLKSIMEYVKSGNVIELVHFADVYRLDQLFQKCCEVIHYFYKDESVRNAMKNLDPELCSKIHEALIESAWLNYGSFLSSVLTSV